MRCFILLIALLIYSQSFAQRERWQSYFSYQHIQALAWGDQEVFAATDNALLVYNTADDTTETITTIQGLQIQEVTAIHYQESFQKLIIGNKDGSIQIVDRKSNKIYYLDDIKNKGSLAEDLKQINSFAAYKGRLFVATNYGISVLDLNDNSFLDTYYIGAQGDFQQVNQLVIAGGWIYAATQTEGIKRIAVENSNPLDYEQWVIYNTKDWMGIVGIQDGLVGVDENAVLYKIKDETIQEIDSTGASFHKIERIDDRIVVSLAGKIMIYTEQMLLLGTMSRSGSTAAIVLKDAVYIGTQEEGLIRYSSHEGNGMRYLSPAGPLRNQVFSMHQTQQGLWMVFGGYSASYNPHNPALGAYGLSLYDANQNWQQLPYSKLVGAKALSRAVLNPKNKNQLYVSSFHSGLLQIDLDPKNIANSKVVLFNETNTGTQGLEKLDPSVSGVDPDYVSVRINGPAFDRNGTIWVTNSMVPNVLKHYDEKGVWHSTSFKSQLPNAQSSSFGSPIIDKNGTKWIPTYKDGLLAFNEKNGSKIVLLNSNAIGGNLPDNDVRTIAIDKNNQLWIGTAKGLRILSHVDRFNTAGNLETQPIVIEYDGLAEELFYQQNIAKIKVDGANNKWVAIDQAGVFLISPNGQETLHRFTMENAPLPSNTILDIEINEQTGEVFFATEKGVVSFLGGITSGTETYDTAHVYPNPVRPEYQGTVTIAGLLDQSNVKITDMDGNLVFEATSQGGTVSWDTHSFVGRKVRSGVYMIFISSQDGSAKTVKKLMVIR